MSRRRVCSGGSGGPTPAACERIKFSCSSLEGEREREREQERERERARERERERARERERERERINEEEEGRRWGRGEGVEGRE